MVGWVGGWAVDRELFLEGREVVAVADAVRRKSSKLRCVGAVPSSSREGRIFRMLLLCGFATRLREVSEMQIKGGRATYANGYDIIYVK